MVALLAAVSFAVKQSGWGVLVVAPAAVAMSGAALLVARYRVVIDDVGVHRRLVGVANVAWERVVAVRTMPIDLRSGRPAVAVVLDDLTVLSVPIISHVSSLTPETRLQGAGSTQSIVATAG